MPRLSCWTCGRQIYTVAPLGSLFLEERRCPRCGAYLNTDRREAERRVQHRRVNPTDDPGPPRRAGKAKATARAETGAAVKPARPVATPTLSTEAADASVPASATDERRVAERRTRRRRSGTT